MKRTTVPAHVKAHTTGRWAEIIFRALSSRIANRWRFISFRGAAQGEWRGIVDVIAIRKNTSQPKNNRLKRGDLFDVILVQIKGGSAAQPTRDDCIRLREVAKYYRAQAVVQFQWKKGVSSSFLELNCRTLQWNTTTGEAIFG
jgi:hypothetical protein